MRCTILSHNPVILALIAVCVGCTTPQAEEADRRAAMAEAVWTVLLRTTDIDHLRESTGALFFQGVPKEVLDSIAERSGNNLPRLDTALASFDEAHFIDRATGRHATLIEVKTISSGPTKCVFRIYTGFGTVGAADYLLDVQKTDSTWKVSRFELIMES